MHDIRAIRDDPDGFDNALARRGEAPAAVRLLSLDEAARAVVTASQQAQTRRNEASKAIGAAMREGDGAKADALKAEVGELKTRLPELEAAERKAIAALENALLALPNRPDPDVPEGPDEAANVEVDRWGERRVFDFPPREHADIAPVLGMDFETGAAIAGARFTFLRGRMARLHRALGQFMLDLQTGQHGYEECAPPLLVREEAMVGTGQLPKFGDDSFRTTDGRWLIPTAEVSLTNSVRERMLDDLLQPVRLTALTPCFRSEAGAAGRDTRGFIRQHQFEKVELVSICRPQDSAAEHERMTGCAEAVLRALGLPYRKMLLCTGDMGATARKTYDLEVWLPGQDAWREISSCSNTGDYQARRMNARYRDPETGKPAFVHTLNGSGLAVGRTLVALIENGQRADGSVAIPEVLHAYTGGMTELKAG